MALRDPRNQSRNNASRRTTSATRSKRAASTSKYNPKPTSASQRSGKTNTGSLKITQGKGGEVKSPRLKQALDSVKTKRTPAKTPPKTTVKTNPASSTPRGAQGPRTAPVQGPYRKPSSTMGGNTGRTGATDSQGRRLNQPPKTAPRNAPPTQKYKPRVSNVGPQIRQREAINRTNQARRVAKANPGRANRAARTARGRGPLTAIATTLADRVLGPVARTAGYEGGKRVRRALGGGEPTLDKNGNKIKPTRTPKPTPKPKPKPKPVQKNPIKAPPKKGSTVLAKKGGKEGVMRNGVFYGTGWSAAQRQRYAVQSLKK